MMMWESNGGRNPHECDCCEVGKVCDICGEYCPEPIAPPTSVDDLLKQLADSLAVLSGKKKVAA